MDLITLFRSLRTESTVELKGGNAFAAIPIPAAPTHRLGCDVDGAPCLLLDVRRPKADQPPPLNVALAHLAIQHDVLCRLVHGAGVEESRLTLVRLVNADRELRAQFLRVAGPVVQSLGARPTTAELMHVVAALVDLFRALERPARRTVQGLWSELLLLASASDTVRAIRAWHATPSDRFDFAAGQERIEIKSTGRGRRNHHFSVDQLTVPAGTSLLVASLFVESVGGGCSLGELLEEVCTLVRDDPALVARVNRLAFEALGNTLSEALTACFDRELAMHSLTWFRGEDIPCVARPLPTAVSDVRFVADLTTVSAVEPAMVRLAGPLSEALLPHAR